MRNKFGGLRVTPAKSGMKRVTLGRWQLVGFSKEWTEQLMQSGEGQLSFCLHAGSDQDDNALRFGQRARQREQRGLADARLATHNEGRATVVDAIEQLSEQLNLALASK